MAFLFRTIFWLSLAMVVVPPEARLGGRDTAEFRNVDMEPEFRNAAFAAWSYASALPVNCDTNPRLCHAAAGLWDTAWKTAADVGTLPLEGSTTDNAPVRPAVAKNGRNGR